MSHTTGTTEQQVGETLRSASVVPSTWDDEDNSVEVVFSTGADALKYDWRRDEVYVERLPLDGMDLSELNSGAHVLRAHDSSSLDAVLGSVVPDSARIANDEAIARVRFSDQPSDAEIVAKVKSGVIRRWSYGYRRNGTPATSTDEESGLQVRTWESHTPYELSPVPVPADGRTGTRNSQENNPMESEKTTPVVETVQPDEDALREARVEGARAEAQRQSEIRGIASKLKLEETDIRSFVEDADCTVESFRTAAIDLVAERADALPTHPQHSGIVVTRDAGDVQMDGLRAALESRLVPGTELPEYAQDFRGSSLLDIAKARLEMSGVRTRGRTNIEVAEMALHTRAGGHTTSDFPYLLANSLNKVLRAQRAMLDDYLWYEKLATRNDFRDFKVRSQVSLSGLGVLPEVPEGAEYVSVTMDEAREQYSAVKYGAEFPLTLEMLVNDDLGAFLRLVQKFGRSAVITNSAVARGLLTAPQTMGDGVALFHADHANLSTSGGAPDVDKLDELDAMLRAQTDGNGEVIGLPGRYIIAPGTLRKGIEQLYSDRWQPTDAADALVTDIPKENRIYIPGLTGTAYFMGSGDPSAMEFGFLAGEGGPVVTSYMEEKSDSVVYHGRNVFGVRILDASAFASNPGA